MLRTQLIHPQILGALAEAGHGSQLLISDGNFPHVTATPPGARRVYLNLSPGRVTVTEVLAAVAATVPLEAAAVMQPTTPPSRPSWASTGSCCPPASLSRWWSGWRSTS